MHSEKISRKYSYQPHQTLGLREKRDIQQRVARLSGIWEDDAWLSLNHLGKRSEANTLYAVETLSRLADKLSHAPVEHWDIDIANLLYVARIGGHTANRHLEEILDKKINSDPGAFQWQLLQHVHTTVDPGEPHMLYESAALGSLVRTVARTVAYEELERNNLDDRHMRTKRLEWQGATSKQQAETLAHIAERAPVLLASILATIHEEFATNLPHAYDPNLFAPGYALCCVELALICRESRDSVVRTLFSAAMKSDPVGAALCGVALRAVAEATESEHELLDKCTQMMDGDRPPQVRRNLAIMAAEFAECGEEDEIYQKALTQWSTRLGEPQTSSPDLTRVTIYSCALNYILRRHPEDLTEALERGFFQSMVQPLAQPLPPMIGDKIHPTTATLFSPEAQEYMLMLALNVADTLKISLLNGTRDTDDVGYIVSTLLATFSEFDWHEYEMIDRALHDAIHTSPGGVTEGVLGYITEDVLTLDEIIQALRPLKPIILARRSTIDECNRITDVLGKIETEWHGSSFSLAPIQELLEVTRLRREELLEFEASWKSR